MARETVSYSEVSQFLRCKLAHFYSYGMSITRIQTSDALSLGTFIHTGLEARFKAIMEGASESDADEAGLVAITTTHLASNPTLAARALECYGVFLKANPFKGMKILSVEEDFMVEVLPGLKVPFKPDLVLMDHNGEIGVVDHKNTSDFMTQDEIDLQPQLPSYAGFLRVLGKTVNWIGFSNIRTYQFKKAEDNNNLDKRYRFTKVRLTDANVKQTLREQVEVAAEIQALKDLPMADWKAKAYRTRSKMVCQNCSFKSLCLAELNQDQPKLVLQTEYEKRERFVYDENGKQIG